MARVKGDFRADCQKFGRKSMRFVTFVAAMGCATVLFSGVGHSSSSTLRDFIVPADDGYGMDDCLAEGGPCAKLIADSWCEVNGMKSSIRYSAADPSDVTASLTKKASAKTNAPIYIVTCAD
jgi:hypothetical protein